MKKYIVFLIALLSSITTYSQQVDKCVVYFNSDDHQVDSPEVDKLGTFFKGVDCNSVYDVSIFGYTNSIGTDEYNFDLSKKRIESVYYILQQTGLHIHEVEKIPFGETNPLYSNSTANGLSKNRRVEVFLYAKQTADVPEKKSSLQELLMSLQDSNQIFAMIPSRANVFTTRNNCVIGIPSNAFLIPDSLRRKEVKLEVREVFDKKDMIAHNLQTVSNKHLLETAGMIYITAYVDDVRVNLKHGKKIDILVNPVQFDPQMELFYGKRNEHQHMNWVISDDSLRCFDHVNYNGPCSMYNFEICPLFFCQIRRMLMSKKSREELRLYQDRQRDLQKAYYRTCIARKQMIDDFYRRYGANADRLLNEIQSRARDLRSYLIQTNQLGWFNIDKFVKEPEMDFITLNIMNKPHPGTIIQVVFNDRSSCVSANPDQDQYVVPSMPVEEDITIVGIRFNADHSSSIAIMQHNLLRGDSVTIEFEPCSESEIRQRLRDIKQWTVAVR